MKKLFIFDVDNTIDLITNSSSELFVLQGDTKSNVTEMIKSEYPNYLNEYAELKSLDELNNGEFETYLSYAYHDWDDDEYIAKEFDIAPEILYENYEGKGDSNYWYGRYSENGIKLLKSKINPKTYFLFSHDENPTWEMQEKLECIASRFHLG